MSILQSSFVKDGPGFAQLEQVAEEIIKEETVTSDETAEQKSSESRQGTETHEPRKIENLEKALRIFKRKSAGIISEVRKREAYDSPSVKRKKKSKEARKHKNKTKNYRFNNNY